MVGIDSEIAFVILMANFSLSTSVSYCLIFLHSRSIVSGETVMFLAITSPVSSLKIFSIICFWLPVSWSIFRFPKSIKGAKNTCFAKFPEIMKWFFQFHPIGSQCFNQAAFLRTKQDLSSKRPMIKSITDNKRSIGMAPCSAN
ncbi:hypothetical protein DERF_003561 [Dermatophagoides farinae]|uniref:Uncharacterized protein n=1 Tax=Dermatophagoides farinae TaxID=6954 RepID=A0A922LAP6_DERFA|nr:hypothetical protein DERF_003561 [Dermatophagoides farinae]